MTPAFSPAWWLPGPHAMTLWPRFFRARRTFATTTECWETPDGDALEIVRLPAPASAPRILLLHGLEGSTRSHYVAGLFEMAMTRGWSANLLLFRTCNGKINRVRRSYHSGETSDLDFVVRRLADESHDLALGLIGVSLGANVLLKWLGELANDVPAVVRGAIAVSTPFDLARSSRRIDRGFSRVYQRHFLRSLRRKALAKIDRFPGVASREAVLASRTFWQFDDAFTSVVHGFRDAADYYDQSSSIHYLQNIRVPALLLSALDDPFHPPGVLDDVRGVAASNPHLRLEVHDRGGHVGFVEGSWPWRSRFYLDRRAEDFLAERLHSETAAPV